MKVYKIGLQNIIRVCIKVEENCETLKWHFAETAKAAQWDTHINLLLAKQLTCSLLFSEYISFITMERKKPDLL